MGPRDHLFPARFTHRDAVPLLRRVLPVLLELLLRRVRLPVLLRFVVLQPALQLLRIREPLLVLLCEPVLRPRLLRQRRPRAVACVLLLGASITQLRAPWHGNAAVAHCGTPNPMLRRVPACAPAR